MRYHRVRWRERANEDAMATEFADAVRCEDDDARSVRGDDDGRLPFSAPGRLFFLLSAFLLSQSALSRAVIRLVAVEARVRGEARIHLLAR